MLIIGLLLLLFEMSKAWWMEFRHSIHYMAKKGKKQNDLD